MRLLDRYLLRELMVPLPYCLAGFLIFLISSDLITEIDDFRKDRLQGWDIAEYYAARLPDFLVWVLPPVLLLALLYALTNHARHQEFTAMRAAGWSLWRICQPYFGVGLVFTGVVYGLNERLVPDGKERAERIRNRRRAEEQEDPRWKRDVRLRNDRAQRIWRIRAFNVETGELRDPYVEWRLPDGSLRQLRAARAIHTNGVWLFLRGQVIDPPDSAEPIRPFEELAVEELSESPALMRSEYKVTRLWNTRAASKVQLTLAEIVDYRFLHPDLEPRERALLDTQFHARLALPWTCLVVVLIAVPFGAGTGRRNVFVGVASSIFIGLTYFALQQLCMGLGTGGHVAPVVAAWLPNGLFGLGGLVLTARARG